MSNKKNHNDVCPMFDLLELHQITLSSKIYKITLKNEADMTSGFDNQTGNAKTKCIVFCHIFIVPQNVFQMCGIAYVVNMQIQKQF